MDINGYRIVRETLPEEFDVNPVPLGHENVRFVTIDTGEEPHANVLNLLAQASLLGGITNTGEQLPLLEPYLVSEKSITFVDNSVDDYKLDHLDEEELNKVNAIKAAEDPIDIVKKLNNAGFAQRLISEAVGMSRPGINVYINKDESEKKVINENVKNSIIGLKNTFLDLVGVEGYQFNVALGIIDCFYSEISKNCLQHPFKITPIIRAEIQLAEKLQSEISVSSRRVKFDATLNAVHRNGLIARSPDI